MQGPMFKHAIKQLCTNWSKLNLKPWSNGLARWRKLLSRFQLVFCLATHLHWPCDDFGWAHINMQVDTSFLPFGHSMQVHTTWLQVNCTCMHEIYLQLFVTCVKLASQLANPFRRPSLYAMHVLTCINLRVDFARGLNQNQPPNEKLGSLPVPGRLLQNHSGSWNEMLVLSAFCDSSIYPQC